MSHTSARPPARPGPHDPASPGPDLLATIVRGVLALIFGCGGAVIFLLVLAVLLSLFLS